jgi:hypothetical protein
VSLHRGSETDELEWVTHPNHATRYHSDNDCPSPLDREDVSDLHLERLALHSVERNERSSRLAGKDAIERRLGSGAELFYFCSDRCRDRFLSRSGR